MGLEEAIDASLGQEWTLKEAAKPIIGRYFFKEKKHILRTSDTGELEKDLVLVNPKGRVFVVVDSYQATAHRFEHVLKVEAPPVNREQWSVANV